MRRRHTGDIQDAIHTLENLDLDFEDAPDAEIDTSEVVSSIESAIEEAVESAVSDLTRDFESYKDDCESKISDIQEAISEAADALENAATLIEDRDREIEELKEKLAVTLDVPEVLRPAVIALIEAFRVATAPKAEPVAEPEPAAKPVSTPAPAPIEVHAADGI